MKKKLILKIALIGLLALGFINLIEPTSKKDAGLAHYVGKSAYSHGSAFKIKYKGYIITAEHVCTNNVALLIDNVITKVIYTNKEFDFCVLDGKNVKTLKTLRVSMKELLAGQRITLVGYPTQNIYSPSIEKGRVIGMDVWNVMYQDGPRPIYVKTVNARSFPGNSGGPLFRNGKVVGILVAGEYQTHVGGVIPINTVLDIIKKEGL